MIEVFSSVHLHIICLQVSLLGGVPVLITPGDMSNTIPDEKVTATFIGYLAVRLLDLSRLVFGHYSCQLTTNYIFREIKAARTIQLAWRKHYASKREELLKVKFKS